MDCSDIWEYIVNIFDTSIMEPDDLKLIFAYDITPAALYIEVEANGMISNSFDFTEHVYDVLYRRMKKSMPNYFAVNSRRIGKNDYGEAYQIKVTVDRRRKNFIPASVLGLMRIKGI